MQTRSPSTGHAEAEASPYGISNQDDYTPEPGGNPTQLGEIAPYTMANPHHLQQPDFISPHNRAWIWTRHPIGLTCVLHLTQRGIRTFMIHPTRMGIVGLMTHSLFLHADNAVQRIVNLVLQQILTSVLLGYLYLMTTSSTYRNDLFTYNDAPLIPLSPLYHIARVLTTVFLAYVLP
ncbi:hypothetical protein M378DRAFT_171894 [Amanita muscaria Koide BX008]|uniref:Uncharacterized protein n=1 Tax=Amanita muscaria (strain Koide BX008) TaxID=946122 RepID=A0A0C2STC1_AMAMK|nr:hypothetical protein M378DRAFT_171894 [Amanita muscaria Koide BX008]